MDDNMIIIGICGVLTAVWMIVTNLRIARIENKLEKFKESKK